MRGATLCPCAGVRLVRSRRAALAVHPAGVAACVVLLLPDRQPVFDLIDDVAAGAECLIAMARAHAHPYGKLAHGKPAHPMDTRRMIDAEALGCCAEDALGLLVRKRREGLVFQRRHGLALIEIAHPAFEGSIAAAGGIESRARNCGTSMGSLESSKLSIAAVPSRPPPAE
jgi:hypothetical protein